GAFATFTNVSAADFGEGSFDKGIYLTIPLDLFYVRNVRSSVGIAWRPLIRDGGQQLIIRSPLLSVTQPTTLENFRRNWKNIGD
ncbi:MAG: YjbH domain-containing protein, partial [Alphaproteobacteria bacterium]|nr:YjbH domain-containing protein [Alphaproteobacteria bacterium]